MAAAAAPSPAPSAGRSVADVFRRAVIVAVSLYLFVLALELLKKGAGGIAPILSGLDVDGPAGALGFGWLMACVVLSGSPVAAIALTLLAAGTLASGEAFAMIGGSRLGASFVVLVIGALDDLRHRGERRSAYIGVAALVTTALVYLPALAIGYAGLRAGWLSGLRIEGRELASLVDALMGPLVSRAVSMLPRAAVFVLGIGGLITAFYTFDRVLPDLRRRREPLPLVGQRVYRPWFMFVVGLAITAVTLSVSVSLSLLVPLAARGYVRRENVWPYIMGANITTFDDTLFAAALVGHPDAVRIVVLLAASVTLLSIPIVIALPYAFGRLVDGIARRATSGPAALALFVTGLIGVPVALLCL